MLEAAFRGWVSANLCLVTVLTLQAQGQPARLRVAVYPFGQSAVDVNIQRETGGKMNYGDIVAQLLVGELTSQVDIINRDQMERLLSEQGRKFDERFDPSQAPEFGKLLGVDAIISGNITALSAEQNAASGLGGKASAIGSVMGIGKGTKINTDKTTVNVNVQITAAMISTVTGKTLGSYTGDGAATKQIAGKIQINDKGTNDSSTSKSGYDPYIREALQDAVRKVGPQFSAVYISAPRAPIAIKTAEVKPNPAPAPPPSQPNAESGYIPLTDEVGNVFRVDGDVMTFFLAQGAKLSKGETLEVQHADMVKNPRNGKVIPIGQTLGTLKLTEVSAETGKGIYQGKPASDQDRLVRKQAGVSPVRERPANKQVPEKP